MAEANKTTIRKFDKSLLLNIFISHLMSIKGQCKF